MNDPSTPPTTPVPAAARTPVAFGPARMLRVAVAGLLMGMANLIPGVSGGTMVLAMGFYQEFIDSVADVTALRLSPRRLAFLGLLGGAALLAIVGLAGVILYLLFHFSIAMYATFIGLTLGGAPTLLRALRPLRAGVLMAIVAGVALMVGVLLLKQGAGFPHNAAMDVFAGLVGATTMVLPGVSGSYMLLVMDQYERVVGAVRDLNLAIIVPVGGGAVLGVVGLAHLLKLLLRRWPRPTVGVLLGILLGSVLGLWPFGKPPKLETLERRSVAELRAFSARWAIPLTDVPNEGLAAALVDRWDTRGVSGYEAVTLGRAIALAIAGFAVTFWLGRTGRRARAGEETRAGM